jgi:hypothetical protein
MSFNSLTGFAFEGLFRSQGQVRWRHGHKKARAVMFCGGLQVSVHLKGVSECFECMSRPPPKGFPICTIRNTPEKPIHCIVWAKDLLFERLFGPREAVTDLDEREATDAAGAEADAGAQQGCAFETQPTFSERLYPSDGLH